MRQGRAFVVALSVACGWTGGACGSDSDRGGRVASASSGSSAPESTTAVTDTPGVTDSSVATDGGRPAAFDGNLLFVMIDTVRADRLGVAGYRRDGRSLTPRLDAFASTATRFSRAYAHGVNTPRSMPTIWASRYPSQLSYHKLFHNFPAIGSEEELLFERLAAAGLHTVGFSSHFYFAPRRNVTQGFAEYDNEGARSIADSNKDFAAPRIVPKAIARLERLAAEQRRFAMFVHLFAPHSTYLEHDEYPVKHKGVAGLEEKYDYEIAMVDRYVGDLLDTLERVGLAGSTMVVVLSDHGEAFGAHSFDGTRLYFHGQALYDEVLRVPLLIRVPGSTPSVNDQVVGLIDVAPTVLDVFGVPAPARFMGRSVLPLMRGESLPPRAIGAQLQRTPAWDDDASAYISGDGSEKIIVRANGQVQVFDLASDPQELTDVARVDAARTARLKAELEAWTASLGSAAPADARQ